MVDDEPMLLDLAHAILHPKGYKLALFRTGEAAVRSLQESPAESPGLLITDYAMGLNLMNGLEVIRQYRSALPGIRVLLLSGTVDNSIYLNSNQKPDAFLAKPYRPQQLVQAVEKLLAHQSSTTETP